MKERRIALASDFDGTLYFMDRKPEVTPEVLEELARFRAAGGLFGICTGRSLQGVRLVMEEDAPFDFCIAASGAMIVDGSWQTLHKECIRRELAEELYRRFEQVGRYAVIQANDTVYSFSDRYRLQTRISSFEELADADFYGISVGTQSLEEALQITEELNRLYGDEITAFTNVFNVDVVSVNSSKGRALEVLRRELDLDLIAGIGDSYNDVPMLQAADLSFTFDYSPETVQEQADYVVRDLSEALRRMTELCRA